MGAARPSSPPARARPALGAAHFIASAGPRNTIAARNRPVASKVSLSLPLVAPLPTTAWSLEMSKRQEHGTVRVTSGPGPSRPAPGPVRAVHFLRLRPPEHG